MKPNLPAHKRRCGVFEPRTNQHMRAPSAERRGKDDAARAPRARRAGAEKPALKPALRLRNGLTSAM